ncbi:MAG: thiamine-phosphate kinase [Desulfovibrio sp.]|nr:thiamine-phosphate kinase [Desulfovibrio sp.]
MVALCPDEKNAPCDTRAGKDADSCSAELSGNVCENFSEDGILALLDRHFPTTHPALKLGRGDDCAVLAEKGPLAVSSDLFLEDVHFRRSYFRPEDIGYKALAVNISDLAACGARPRGFELCLGLPESITIAWLEAFFSGMAGLARQHAMVLAGGDLSRSPSLHISLTVWGDSAGHEGFLVRGGSMPGDVLFVVGRLGLARVGLHILEERGREALRDWPDACAAHLRPQPQVDAGRMLARAGFNARPPALMDISDGLMQDLPRLLGQTGGLRASGHGVGFGAEIVLARGQLHPEVLRHAAHYGRDPVRETLLGGEDYALLGSCAPDMLPALNAAIPGLFSLGVVTDSGSIVCNNETLDGLRGFDHFAFGRC